MTIADAAEKLEAWRRYYKEERPHGAIGNKAPIKLTKSGGITMPVTQAKGSKTQMHRCHNKLRISYIHGPGDAFGTFVHWKANRSDSGIIKQTYSSQFYDLISDIDGVGQVICVTQTEPTHDPRFQFETVRRCNGSGIRYFVEEFRYARAVSVRIRDFGPDVILISSDFPSFAFDALPRKPVKVLSMHNTFWKPYGKPKGAKEKILNFARRISLRHTDLAVCVSLECQRQFEEVRSSSSAFSVLQIPRLTKNFGAASARVPERLLFVGRLEINKGIEDLVRAFNAIKPALPNITLKIVGDGGALECLKRLVARLNLEAAIEFTGRLGATDVGRAYADADLCICPTQWSFNEGLATVPLEAASYGVPTIMSHAVPAKEFFGEDSIVFVPGNIEDLASKMEQAISDIETYRRARVDAREAFIRTMHNVGDWKSGVSSCLRTQLMTR